MSASFLPMLSPQPHRASTTRSSRPAYFFRSARFFSSSAKPMDISSRSFSSWASASGLGPSAAGGDAACAISFRTNWMASVAAVFGSIPFATSSRNLAVTFSLSMAAAGGRACVGAGAVDTGGGGDAGGDGRPSSCGASLRRFATRSRRPLYLSSSSTAWTQFSKPISPSSLSCGANRFDAAAAFGGAMPKATRRSKTATSSVPRISASSGSVEAAGVSWPSRRRSNISCALPSASAQAESSLRGSAAPTCGASLGSSSIAWVGSASAVSRWRNSASCRAKFRAARDWEASSGPSSRQWPGHFCTKRNSPAAASASGSDSTQVRTCCSGAARSNRRCSRPPAGSRRSSWTPSVGSAGNSCASCLQRSKRFSSLKAASRRASSSRACRSSSARCSASVCSLGRTSTVRSVSRRHNADSGSSSRTSRS
mmetsp:Transcript_19144/g.43358  ORF Transcript_19144/g.43358 Transcript_19144/m.43358 type:complete len:426 (-) Transcript_19144:272-1549(-)